MHFIYAHLIGDYLIQNDWMAQNKKKPGWFGAWTCFVHVVTYMVPFLWCGMRWTQLLLIACQHWLIDRYGFVAWFMKKKGSEKFMSGPCFPWSMIVVDNVLHILWMAWVASNYSLAMPHVAWGL